MGNSDKGISTQDIYETFGYATPADPDSEQRKVFVNQAYNAALDLQTNKLDYNILTDWIVKNVPEQMQDDVLIELDQKVKREREELKAVSKGIKAEADTGRKSNIENLKEKSKTNVPKLKAISARELYDTTFEPIFYPVEGLVPEGTTILSAPPKCGKSWLVLDMVLCVSSGTDFLGFPVHQCECMYLALEDGDNFEQDRLHKIRQSQEIPEGCHFVFTDVVNLDNGFEEQIEGIMQQYPQLKLLVIDTLAFVESSARRGESAYNCDYRNGRELKAIAAKYHLAIVIVTHSRQLTDPSDELANVSGTNGKIGACDSVVVLGKKSRTDKEAALFVDGRRVRQSKRNIRFNPDSLRWELINIVDLDRDSTVRAEEMAKNNYLNNPIRKAIVDFMVGRSDWTGRAGQLISAATEEKIFITATAYQTGSFIKKNQALFGAWDNLKVSILTHGKGTSPEYRFESIEIPDEDAPFTEESAPDDG